MKIRIRNFLITNNLRITKLEPIVAGFRSQVNNYQIYDVRNRHIPILDYDDLPEKELKKDVKKLQRKFHLSHAVVARSSIATVYRVRVDRTFPFLHFLKNKIDKWHVYFPFNARNYFDIIPIIHYSKCDRQYKKWRMLRDSMVARYTPKSNDMIPEVVMVIESPYGGHDYGYLEKVKNILKKEKELKKIGKIN